MCAYFQISVHFPGNPATASKPNVHSYVVVRYSENNYLIIKYLLQIETMFKSYQLLKTFRAQEFWIKLVCAVRLIADGANMRTKYIFSSIFEIEKDKLLKFWMQLEIKM